MKTKTIGIVGSRRRNNPRDYKVVRNKLLSLILSEGLDFKKVTLISGGCPEGADKFAEKIARDYGMKIKIHYPDKSKIVTGQRWEWTKINYERNTLIARDSDTLIACVASDRKGGTEDTIKKYQALGKTELILV